MVRPLRINYPGAFYHVMNRGQNKQNIFFDETTDRKLFMRVLDESVLQWRIRIHAYSLMSNHYHLLVETPLGNLSRAMRHIDGVYTQRLNKKWGRDGSLFRGRFKSILVENDSYFLELIRYIHLNGTREGLFASPRKDPFTSHSAYLNADRQPRWLTTQTTLLRFDTDQNHAVSLFEKFIDEGVPTAVTESIEKSNRPAVIGPAPFVQKACDRLPSTMPNREIPQKRELLQQCTPSAEAVKRCIQKHRTSVNISLSETQWTLIHTLRSASMLTFTQIARELEMTYKAVQSFYRRHDFSTSKFLKTVMTELIGSMGNEAT